jgi:hypothetical protein
MNEKVLKLGLVRDDGVLLYVKGRAIYKVGRDGGPAPELVTVTDIQPDPFFVYFIDQDGDLARTRRVLDDGPPPVVARPRWLRPRGHRRSAR